MHYAVSKKNMLCNDGNAVTILVNESGDGPHERGNGCGIKQGKVIAWHSTVSCFET